MAKEENGIMNVEVLQSVSHDPKHLSLLPNGFGSRFCISTGEPRRVACSGLVTFNSGGMGIDSHLILNIV